MTAPAVPVLELRYRSDDPGGGGGQRAGDPRSPAPADEGSWRMPDPEGLGVDAANRRLEELLPGGRFDPDAIGVPRLDPAPDEEDPDDGGGGSRTLYRLLGFREAAADPDDLRSVSVLLREIDSLRDDDAPPSAEGGPDEEARVPAPPGP